VEHWTVYTSIFTTYTAAEVLLTSFANVRQLSLV